MCGICGFTSPILDKRKYLNDMVEQLSSRGPDAKGVYSNESINLGHTRLSVIDLNERSNQPFFDKQTGNMLVFNGEIYNFKEIKRFDEKKIVFLQQLDTEVVCYTYYGLDCFSNLMECCIAVGTLNILN